MDKQEQKAYAEEKAKEIVSWAYRITETEPNLEIHVFNLRSAENIILSIIKDCQVKVSRKIFNYYATQLIWERSDFIKANLTDLFKEIGVEVEG